MITIDQYLADRHGRTFADVVRDPDASFEHVLDFFNDPERQRRMEEAEIHHDRPPLAGVVRELESLPSCRSFFETLHRRRSTRFRQAIGVLVRMIMTERGWTTTGKKGSLGVRAGKDKERPAHNTGGLAFWFLRAERYVLDAGMPYRGVRELYGEFAASCDRRESGKKATPARPKKLAESASGRGRRSGADEVRREVRRPSRKRST